MALRSASIGVSTYRAAIPACREIFSATSAHVSASGPFNSYVFPSCAPPRSAFAVTPQCPSRPSSSSAHSPSRRKTHPAPGCSARSTSVRSAENCSAGECTAPSSSPSACLPPCGASSETISHNLPLPALNSARSVARLPLRSPQSRFLPVAPGLESESTPDKRSPHRAAPPRGWPFPRNPRSPLPFPPEPWPPPLWTDTLRDASPRFAPLLPALLFRQFHSHR